MSNDHGEGDACHLRSLDGRGPRPQQLSKTCAVLRSAVAASDSRAETLDAGGIGSLTGAALGGLSPSWAQVNLYGGILVNAAILLVSSAWMAGMLRPTRAAIRSQSIPPVSFNDTARASDAASTCSTGT